MQCNMLAPHNNQTRGICLACDDRACPTWEKAGLAGLCHKPRRLETGWITGPCDNVRIRLSVMSAYSSRPAPPKLNQKFCSSLSLYYPKSRPTAHSTSPPSPPTPHPYHHSPHCHTLLQTPVPDCCDGRRPIYCTTKVQWRGCCPTTHSLDLPLSPSIRYGRRLRFGV